MGDARLGLIAESIRALQIGVIEHPLLEVGHLLGVVVEMPDGEDEQPHLPAQLEP